MVTRNVQSLSAHLVHSIPVWWPQIEDMAQRAIHASDDTYSADMLTQAVASGEFTLWVIHDNKELRGFYTTEILRIADGLVQNVPFAAFDNDLKALLFAFNHAERVAKGAGFKGFKFISSDPRWAKLMEKMGLAD